MTLMPPLVNTLYLPWSVDTDSVAMRQNRMFRRWLGRLFVVFLLVGIILPLVPVPTLVHVQPVVQPERLSRVVVELPEAKPQAPAPVKPVPEPLSKPLSKPVEAPSPVAPSNNKQEPSPEPPPPGPSAQEIAEATRQQAKRSGLLQFQDQLQAMRKLAAVDHRASDLVGETKAALPQRQLVGRSKGNRPSPSASLATAVDAVILPDQAFGALAAVSENMSESMSEHTGTTGAQATSTRAPDQLRGRADEEIRSIMDRNKGAIFAIYNRALRSKPLLRGKLTIEMVIAADGSITTAVLVASDLGDSELESRLLTRIRMITFSAAAVAATTLNYSFEFLPG